MLSRDVQEIRRDVTRPHRMATKMMCTSRAIAKSTQKRCYFEGTLAQCLTSSHTEHLDSSEKDDLRDCIVMMMQSQNDFENVSDDLKRSMIEQQFVKVYLHAGEM